MFEFSPSGSIFCEMGVGMKKEKQVEQIRIPTDRKGARLLFFHFGRVSELPVFTFLFLVISLNAVGFNHVQ